MQPLPIHTLPFLCALVLGVSMFSTTDLEAKTFAIGAHGSRMQLPGGWQRKEHIAGLGRDQFVGPEGQRVTVIEIVSALDHPSGILDTYRSWVDNIGASSGFEIQAKGEPVQTESRGFVVVRGPLRIKDSGMTQHHELAVLAKDGLRYHCMAYSLAQHQDKLEATMDSLIKRFQFPRPSSEWARDVVPVTFYSSFDWGTLRIRYRKPMWEPMPDSEGLFAVEEVYGLTRFLAFEATDSSVEEYIEEVTSYLGGFYEGYTVPHQRPRTVGSVTGTELLGVAESGKRTVYSLILPVGEKRCLEFRLDAPLEERVAEPIWRRWSEGLSVEVFDPVEAFSAPEEEPATELSHAVPAIDAWLSSARWLGTAPKIVARGCDRDEDDFIVYGKGGVQRIQPDRSVVDLHTSNETTFSGGDVVVDAEEVHMRFGDTLYVYRDDEWFTSKPEARYRARLAEALILVQRQQEAKLSGFTGLPAMGPEALVVHRPGSEDVVAHPAAQGITTYIAPSGGGDHVFLARRPQNFDRRWFWAHPVPCWQRNAAGDETPCGVWWLRHVGPAPDGWVVTGRPQGGILGVYRVPMQGEPELLVSGADFIGVDLVESRLTVLGKPFAPAVGTSRGTAIYEVDLADVRAHGPLSMPFEIATLNEIAAAVFADKELTDELFATRASVEAFVAACHDLAKERCGRALPRGKVELDAVLPEWLLYSHDVTPEAFALLVALLSDAFLAEGAEWVPGRAWPRGLPDRAFGLPSNSYVATYSPAAILSSTLYDDDGYWRPVSEVLAKVEGRELLIGLDAKALRQRHAQSSEAPAWQLLAEAKVAPLQAHLKKHKKKHYLRYEVYRHLAAEGRTQDMLVASAPFVTVEQPLFFDVRANLSARGANVTADTRDALVTSLRAAILRFPRAPALYALLGEAYLGYERRDDYRRAKQCFDRVLSLTDSGDHAVLAREALKGILKKKTSL